jgi:Arc/MetJ-type ribon-helix-helix transcriptional regulator
MERKDNLVTFKVTREMKAALDSAPNRSEFVRQAIAKALDLRCPNCGTLLPEQQPHEKN